MRDKYRHYVLERALARELNGDFIPAEKLIWVPVTSWNPFESVYETWDEANITRIEKQKNDNNFYYRVAG